MVQGPSPEIIECIRNPPSLDAQIARLKQLKNEVNGHDQRKELAVRQGVVEPLVAILAAPAKAAGKRSANGGSGVAAQQHLVNSWTKEHDARLEATLVLSSLANGGPAFVQPLLAAGLGNALVHLNEDEDPPRLVTATLQALKNLAASAALATEPLLHPGLLSSAALGPLLKRALLNTAVKQQQKLAAEIVTLLANNESLRLELADGLLDTLASLLVSNTVANNYFEYRGSTSHLPAPPPDTTVPHILSAVTAVVTGSKFRIQCFILSPPIRDFFASLWSDNADSRFPFNSRNSNFNPFERLLPQFHVPITKSVSFSNTSAAFPATLAPLQPNAWRSTAGRLDGAQLVGDVDHANDVVKWLVFLARSMGNLNRLVALRLLALVNHAIDAEFTLDAPRNEAFQRQRERERLMAMLAVPLVVQLIQDTKEGTEAKSSDPFPPVPQHEIKEVKEQTCDVLALLIRGSKELQSAAAEAGATKRVCPVLKHTFDTVNIARPMWSANTVSSTPVDVSESCKMGMHGLPPEIRHVMLCRKSALESLAALASKEDVHRKAIVDTGVVSCVIDSLRPLTPEFSARIDRGDKPPHQFTAKDGNTTPVILAACHAAQSLSRSVSLLRTSLIDAGIANPIFDLLNHSDREVQIAATDVCCNLLLEFSPMREDLLAAGAIKTLTEHARQSEMGLRLSSLWALKHLMLSSSKEVKVQCLEELGPGWLVGAIQGEQNNAATEFASISAGGVSISPAGGLSTANAAGEQVNILNPSNSMDVDEQAEDDEALDDDEEEEDDDGEVMYDEASGTNYQSSQLRSTLPRLRSNNNAFPAASSSSNIFNSARYLSSVRELEQNPALQAQRDDIAVQEQALDFIRNMLNGDDCAFMIEHLLRTIGQDKLFSLLNEKLAPITPSPPPTTASSTSTPPSAPAAAAAAAKPIHHPTELILTTIHVLVHIANGSPVHKQLLIAQKPLLAHWLPHFHHPDRRVRVISVCAVISLTWVENDADRVGAAQRAKELRVCGIEEAVRRLAGDEVLDVRERVKSALRQIEAL